MRISYWIISVACVLAVALYPTGASAQKKGGGRTTVTIDNSRYSPGKVSVKVGDTVVWTNQDDRDHTVVANDGSFASGNIKPGKSFPHTFRKEGTYSYGCRLHPRMKGTVVVTD